MWETLSGTSYAPLTARGDYDSLSPKPRSEMPEVPDVSAIARQVKARIKQIEDQLKQHHKLTDGAVVCECVARPDHGASSPTRRLGCRELPAVRPLLELSTAPVVV